MLTLLLTKVDLTLMAVSLWFVLQQLPIHQLAACAVFSSGDTCLAHHKVADLAYFAGDRCIFPVYFRDAVLAGFLDFTTLS